MLSRIGETQVPLPAPVALSLGVLTFVLVLGTALWNLAVHAETVVHEAAHTIVGFGAGRKIRGVNINQNTGGSTAMDPASGFGYGVAASVGYVGASAAGLFAAWLISKGHIVAVLWLGLLLMALMLLMIRNFFGGVVVLCCGALLYLTVRYTTTGVQTIAAYVATWFLLISAPRRALVTIRRPKDVADAKILAGMTPLWASAWCYLWLLGTIAALVAGGALLV